MKQGVLPFQYEQEKSSPGMTAMAGMMTYLELMHAAGLRSSVERHVGLRECGQGWTDSQVVSSLILLNLAGGESVVDLDVLEKDAGLCRVLREVESYGMGRRERRALEERWRVERRRSMPSESAVFRYLERFHEAGEESSREAHRAFIPSPNEALGGLHKVNADMVSFVQSRSPCAQATLDMDATLVETHKQQALYSYKKYKAYQPLTTYWAEAELIVHSEFRGRQRTCWLSATASVDRSVGASALCGGQGDAAVGRGWVSARVAAVLRRGQRRALRSDRVCGRAQRDAGVQARGVRGCRTRLACPAPQTGRHLGRDRSTVGGGELRTRLDSLQQEEP